MSDWVTFPGDKRGRVSWRYDPEHAGPWQRLLAGAYNHHKRPHCDCRWRDRPVQLVIHCRIHGGTARYHLACMRDEGPRHGPACPFHRPDSRTGGQAGYTYGVIQPLTNDRVGINLARGLRVQDPAHRPAILEVSPPQPGLPRRRQDRMTQLGLLHLLWERAGLAGWSPEDVRARSRWSAVGHRLEEAAARIVAGREALSERFVPIGYGDDTVGARLADAVRRCGDTHRLLMVALLNRIEHDPARGRAGGAEPLPPRLRLLLDGTRSLPVFVSADSEWDGTLQHRYPWAMRVLTQPLAERSVNVVALILGRSYQKRDIISVRADEIALMEVGPGLVPVASGYELRLLQALQEGKRSFRKPLRYDAAGDAVLPDFVLTDTGNPRGTPLEVFGRTDEAYAARRAEKRAYYDAVFGPDDWWCWDAARDTDWPALPVRRPTP